MSDEPEVLVRMEGAVGRITLNRPQALHALTTNMVRLITQALVTWIDNPIVKLVLIDHAGERQVVLDLFLDQEGGQFLLAARPHVDREPGLPPFRHRSYPFSRKRTAAW